MNYFLQSLKRTFQFSGRAQRAEFWYFMLFIQIMSIFILIVSIPLIIFNPGIASLIISLVFFVLIITQISLSVRRLHDINMSGWWALLFFPLIIPMLIVGLIDSDKDNKYGPNPKGHKDASDMNSTQQKASPEIKDFDYTPYSQNSASSGKTSSASPRPRLPLKDFN